MPYPGTALGLYSGGGSEFFDESRQVNEALQDLKNDRINGTGLIWIAM
jgi:hypothetical protein